MAPHAYILALEGVAALVLAIARRRPAWRPPVAIPVFTWAVVGLVVASAAFYAQVIHRVWDTDRVPRTALAVELDRLAVSPTDRLMTVDAAGFKYFTGRPGVVSPNDSLDTIRGVADAYGIRWLVLERSGIVDALRPVLIDDERPSWIGPAAFTIPASSGGPATLVLYPVCFDPADARCSPEETASR